MRTVALKRLCTVITRGSAPVYSGTDGGTAWAIGQSCQTIEGKFDFARGRWHTGPVPTKGRLKEGDVLINSTGTGTLGRVALVDQLPPEAPCFADGHVTVLRVHDESADSRFIAYLLGLPASRAFIEAGLSVGATKQMELSVEALRTHAVQIPERDAQAEIADFLDRECLRIDELANELARVNDVAMEPSLAFLSDELHGWPQVRIGYVFEVQLGKMLDATRIDAGDTLPYLRNANVYWDRFDLRDLNEMTFSAADRRLYRLRPGDLLVCEGRHVGRSAVWSGEISEMYFQKALHRVRARAGDSTRFLMWCLRLMHDRGDFYADGTGSTIPHLPAERLRAARIPLPPPSDQQTILRRIDDHARAGRQLEDHALTMGSLLSGYRDALITEAVTGQLDVTRLSESQMDECLNAARQGERPQVLAS